MPSRRVSSHRSAGFQAVGESATHCVIRACRGDGSHRTLRIPANGSSLIQQMPHPLFRQAPVGESYDQQASAAVVPGHPECIWMTTRLPFGRGNISKAWAYPKRLERFCARRIPHCFNTIINPAGSGKRSGMRSSGFPARLRSADIQGHNRLLQNDGLDRLDEYPPRLMPAIFRAITFLCGQAPRYPRQSTKSTSPSRPTIRVSENPIPCRWRQSNT